MEEISTLLISYLREFIMKQEVIEKYRRGCKDFTRKRKLPFWRLAGLILHGWKNSAQNRVNRFFKSLGLLDEVATATAFCNARQKILPTLFKAMNEETVNFFYTNYEHKGLVNRWKGYLVYAVDGSCVNLPDTEETREKYSIQTNQYDGQGCVQGLASILYDITNEVVVNAELEKKQSEKSFIFGSHSLYQREDVISLYDRAYADYAVMAYHTKKGKHFVIRSPLSNTFKVVEEFVKSADRDKIVTLQVTSKQKKFVAEHNLPEQIQVRLTKVELENGEIEVLITSFLDQDTYKVEDFKWVYNQRWGVETHLDRLKNKLEVERFSSEKAVGIEQDFNGIIFLSTLESVLSKEDEQQIAQENKEKREKEGIYEYKINKSVSYSALADCIVDLLLNLDKSPSEIVHELRIKFERKKRTPSQKLWFYKYLKRVWA
ncbi:MAG: IS4 family transposase [bacterium]